MSTIIRDYPGRVTVQIDGIAASIATIVAVAGDHVKIQDTAYFAIHDPLFVFLLAALNIEDLTRLKEILVSVKEGGINAYETKTGLSRNRISKMMTDETWMDANKAHDLGFVDEIIKGGSKKIALPENTSVANSIIGNFAHIPPAVMRAIQSVNVPEEVAASEPLLTEDMEREAQSLRELVQTILEEEIHNA
jgi:enoyl-CoA hydratase/carnithine racemase